jgi:phosphoglycerate dehydrogenase-like enzyme
LGAIGVQIANAASMLGMKVIGFDPSITIKSAWKLSADVEQALSVDELVFFTINWKIRHIIFDLACLKCTN